MLVYHQDSLICLLVPIFRRQFCCERFPPKRDGGMCEVHRVRWQAEEHPGKNVSPFLNPKYFHCHAVNQESYTMANIMLKLYTVKYKNYPHKCPLMRIGGVNRNIYNLGLTTVSFNVLMNILLCSSTCRQSVCGLIVAPSLIGLSGF